MKDQRNSIWGWNQGKEKKKNYPYLYEKNMFKGAHKNMMYVYAFIMSMREY